MENHVVALLDILGFRPLIGRTEFESFLEEFGNRVKRIVRDGVEAITFSDTILLAREGSTVDDVLRVATRCSVLLFELLCGFDIPIPVRGALSFGKCAVDFERGIVAGRPIVEAYDLERDQDWAGIMLSPSVIARFPELTERARGNVLETRGDVEWSTMIESLWPASVLHAAKIPRKGDLQPFDGFAVTPIDPGASFTDWSDKTFRQLMKRMNRLIQEAPARKEQRSLEATRDWYSDVRKSWRGRGNKDPKVLRGLDKHYSTLRDKFLGPS